MFSTRASRSISLKVVVVVVVVTLCKNSQICVSNQMAHLVTLTLFSYFRACKCLFSTYLKLERALQNVSHSIRACSILRRMNNEMLFGELHSCCIPN